MSPDPSVDEFDEFARTRTPALLRAAYLLTGDQYLAEDLVQSALGRTLRAWRRLQRTANAEAYTRRVMYHLQVSWWRQRSRERRLHKLASEPHAMPDSTANVAGQLALQEALSRLTVKQRAVIVLRYYEDKSIAETAEILGCGHGTVKSQTAKALQRLRQELPNRQDFREWSLA